MSTGKRLRIKVPDGAARVALTLRRHRDTAAHRFNDFVAGMAAALDVPDGWIYDDEAGQFLPAARVKQ